MPAVSANLNSQVLQQHYLTVASYDGFRVPPKSSSNHGSTTERSEAAANQNALGQAAVMERRGDAAAFSRKNVSTMAYK